MTNQPSDGRTTGELLIEDMTPEERERAARVESVLPALREAAARVDRAAQFEQAHVKTLSDAGLLGLVIPTQYGGLGGSLRDMAAACFAMATACPSTALAYFFHCSSASRGLLPLEALEAGLFSAEEAPVVKAFAEKVLTRMGREGKWLANFGSESNKQAKAAISISTEAKKVDGGWRVSGVKSFGCATGVADYYLVTAKLEGYDTAEGLVTFLIPRDAEGVQERERWDALGMRGTATHGLILKDVFVPEDEALTIPGAFTRMMQMSRGSFVGNQAAGTACYLGAAQAIYQACFERLMTQKFGDTDQPIATSPFHQELIGKMTVDLETASLWLRRQLQLESAPTPILPKQRVVAQWRMCKGVVAEACFRVATNAMKACGTGATAESLPFARALRDTAMGLVQAFPMERGRLEAAKLLTSGAETQLFAPSEKRP